MTIFTKQIFQLKTREGPPDPTGPPDGTGPPGCGPPWADPPGEKIRPLRCRDGPEQSEKDLIKLNNFYKQHMNDTRFTIMKIFKLNKIWWLPVMALFWGVSFSAHALGTASGVTIGNRAYIDYDVGGTAQAQIGSSLAGNSSGGGSDTTFVVDNRVDLVLAESDGNYTGAAPGTIGAVITFTLTNEGNTVQDYSFTDAHDVGSTLFANTDDVNVNITGTFVESGATGGYQVLEDLATRVDELAADGTAIIYVIADIPAGFVDGNYSIVDLTATTRDGGGVGIEGGVTTATAGADTVGVDVVLADGYDDLAVGGLDGDTNDGVNDGAYTDSGAYLVASAILTVTKTSAVISDPINDTTNPKRIPGATVRYTIVVTNSGTTGATSVTLVDAIHVNTTYVAGSITLGGSSETDANDGDDSDFNITNGNSVTSVIGNLASGGGTNTVTFDVTIN